MALDGPLINKTNRLFLSGYTIIILYKLFLCSTYTIIFEVSSHNYTTKFIKILYNLSCCIFVYRFKCLFSKIQTKHVQQIIE